MVKGHGTEVVFVPYLLSPRSVSENAVKGHMFQAHFFKVIEGG